MNSEPHLVLIKKQPFFARFKAGNFLNSLTGTISSSTTGDLKASVKGALSLVKYDTNPGHRAYELIFNALGTAAIRLLTAEHRKLITGNLTNKKAWFNLQVDKTVESIALEISPAFFAAPKNFLLIKTIRPIYKEWLVFLGLPKEIAEQLQRKLAHQFLLELTEEWEERSAHYQLILEQFKTPFYEAWKKEYHTLKYQDELRELIHEPAMGDKKLPLSTIYIKPHFSIHEGCYKVLDETLYDPPYQNDGFISDTNFKESLHQYIEQKIIHKKMPFKILAEAHQLLFILGQPGQGKSSFCLYTTNQLLEHPDFDQNLYFIRLKDLQHKEELIQQPFNVIEDYLKEQHELEFITKDTVLILDGLDELFMVNGLTNNDLEKFYKHLEEATKQSSSLTIILTSRYNYLNLSVINKKKTTILKLDGLNLAQQKKWLSTYRVAHPDCTLTQEKLEEINKDGNLIHIKELIQQPILLHIVAKSNTDLNSQDTRSTIYQDLFDALLQRNWAGGQLEKYHALEKEEYAQEFREWLQHIAFSIYSSNFEYIQRKDLEALSSTKNIQGIINTSANLKDALKDLLVAFYFKNVKKDIKDVLEEDQKSKKYAVEFLHKSLQEYLAAEYIWRTIKDKLLAPYDKSYKFDINDFKQALSLFFSLFSNKALNDSLRTLLIEMIEQDPSIEKKKVLRDRLKQFLSGCLKYQFLDTTVIGNHKEQDTPPLDKAFNTFRGYWLILSHLDRTQNGNLLVGNNKELFCDLVSKGGGNLIELTNINLNDTDLSGADLNRVTFKKSSLISIDLSKASLISTDLSKASLISTDLGNIIFFRTGLVRADLVRADLVRADLVRADFSNADLSDAILSSADLKCADLNSADLRSADLSNADLTGADLSYTDLRYADLKCADLKRADLRCADLRCADLRCVDLKRANLSFADLRCTDLTGADLSDADLSDARVSNINFIEQLEQWNCNGTQGIKTKYYIDPQENYYNEDKNKKHPYYLIKEKQ